MEGEPPELYWRNSDKVVRPVACIDSYEYCTSDGRRCWLLLEETDNADFELTRRDLLRSTTADAIKFRMGRGLLAQDAVTQYLSEQLEQNQWELEFEQLFATSLARMQYNLLDIAVGANEELHRYYEVDKATWGSGGLCARYKLKLPNKINGKDLNFATFVLFVTVFGLFLVATLPVVWQENEEDEKQFLGQKVSVYRAAWRLLKVLPGEIVRACSATGEGVSRCFSVFLGVSLRYRAGGQVE